jgi:hypothetical protein
MNNLQRLVLILGLVIVCGMALFPPWRSPTEWGESIDDYRFVFRPSKGHAIIRVDTARLGVQCLVVLTLTGVAYLILRRHPE